MQKKHIVLPVVILVVGYGLMQLFSSFESEPERIERPQQKKIVEARIVHMEDVEAQVTAYGRVTSSRPVVLYSEVAGRLQQGDVPFLPAQSFKKGDLLLKIDDRQAQLDLNSAKSDFLNALAAVLPEIRIDFPEAYQAWQDYFDGTDFDKNLADLPAVENQKIKLFLSRFNVYKLYFAVRNLEILRDKHFIYAPFAGSIVSTDLRVGSTARAGTKLGEIISLEDVEVEVPVSSRDLQWLEQGNSVTFTSSELPGAWTGTIVRIGSAIEERTQTVPVFVALKQARVRHLFDGLFLKAEMPGLTIKNAAVIPHSALYRDDGVYLIEGGKLAYRQVDIVRRETDRVIVNGGIQTGDTLVVEVMQGIFPGMPAAARFSELAAGSN